MRRQYFNWTYLVLATVLTIYGVFSLIYSHSHNKDIPVLGIVFTVVGISLFLVYLVLFLISIYQRKKIVQKEESEPKIEKKEEIVNKEEKTKVEETTLINKEEIKTTQNNNYTPRKEDTYRAKKSSPSFTGGSGYIRKVGYGPVLRVDEAEILDMRNNTYYRIEGNMVKMSGSGPVFEISGSRIKLAFGGYLYEISGDSVYKTFGGYYASISGGYIQTHDLSQKYETCDLNLKQKLAVVAILFGAY